MLKNIIETWIGEEESTAYQSDTLAYIITNRNMVRKYLKSRIPELEEMILGEIEKATPHEKPMGVFSFVLKGEELEQYMRNKGWNECRSHMKQNIINSLKGGKEEK